MNEDAAFVTRIVIYPHCKALQITSCGGRNLRKWLPEAEKLFEAFARYHGCSRLEIIGRKGWTRIFKNEKVAAVTITRELV